MMNTQFKSEERKVIHPRLSALIKSLETIEERRERLFKKFMETSYAKERKRVWYNKSR